MEDKEASARSKFLPAPVQLLMPPETNTERVEINAATGSFGLGNISPITKNAQVETRIFVIYTACMQSLL